jgi:hypothetical protein
MVQPGWHKNPPPQGRGVNLDFRAVPRAIAGLDRSVKFLSYFSLQLHIRGAGNNIQNVLNAGLRLVELRCA